MTGFTPGAKLLIGCGYLGQRLAARWLRAGHRVLATTRRRDRVEEWRQLGLETIHCDILDRDSLASLPETTTVVFAVGFDRTSRRTMREVYVDGLANVLDHLPPPPRLLYVSSTGVYGQHDGEWVDENAPTDPEDEAGKVVLEAERLLHDRLPEAVVLRFSGIYGPGRLIRAQSLREGKPLAGDPEKYLNLIHVEDGAAALEAAESRARPGQTCNVSDDLPVVRREFYAELARLLDVPEPRWLPVAGAAAGREARGNRRICNRRLRQEWGVNLTYPTYREGLRAAL